MADTMTAPAPAPHAPHGALAACLRQMIAVLERERHALAALDADELICSARDKDALCDAMAVIGAGPQAIDIESRSLAETARRLNEVNRRVRNLLAANVAARIEALGGSGRGSGRGPGRLTRATYITARA